MHIYIYMYIFPEASRRCSTSQLPKALPLLYLGSRGFQVQYFIPLFFITMFHNIHSFIYVCVQIPTILTCKLQNQYIFFRAFFISFYLIIYLLIISYASMFLICGEFYLYNMYILSTFCLADSGVVQSCLDNLF